MSTSDNKESFVTVNRESSYYSEVKEIFKQREAIYGDQTASFKKIKKGLDRRCELLVGCDGKPTSLVVYKCEPVQQVESYPLHNSLEVKTFMLLHEDKNNVSPFEKMFRQIIRIARKANATSFHLTVSEKEPWSVKFFTTHNLKIWQAFNGKYIEGVRETLMSFPLKTQEKSQESFAKERDEELSMSNKQENIGSRSQEPQTSSKRRVESEIGSKHYRDDVKNNPQTSLKRIRSDDLNADASTKQKIDSRNTEPHTSSNRQQDNEMEPYGKRQKLNPERDRYDRPQYEHRSQRDQPPSGFGRRGYSQFGNNDRGRIKECTLKRMYIEQIRDGKKTVEGRLAGGMFSSWTDGDTVRFFCQGAEVFCKIAKVTKYRSFREMLNHEGVSACVPGYESLDRAEKLYLDIPRYKEREWRGVVAFQLKVISKPTH